MRQGYSANVRWIPLGQPSGNPPVATSATLKNIVVRPDELRPKQQTRLAHNQAQILRPPRTGVPRAKTIKAITVVLDRRPRLVARIRHRELAITLALPPNARTGVPRARKLSTVIVLDTFRSRLVSRLRHDQARGIRASAQATATVTPPPGPKTKPSPPGKVRKAYQMRRLRVGGRSGGPVGAGHTIILKSPLKPPLITATVKPILVLRTLRSRLVARVNHDQARIVERPLNVRTGQVRDRLLQRTYVFASKRPRIVSRVRRREPAIISGFIRRVVTPRAPIIVSEDKRPRIRTRRREPILLRAPAFAPPPVKTIKAIIVRTVAVRTAVSRARLRHPELAEIIRPPRTGVPRAKTIGAILVRLDLLRPRSARARRRDPQLLRGQVRGLELRTVKPIIVERDVRPKQVARLRHPELAQIITPSRTGVPRAITIKAIRVIDDALRTRFRARLARQTPAILRTPNRPAAPANPTLRPVFVRTDALRARLVTRLRHDQAETLRAPRLGVARAITIKAILVRDRADRSRLVARLRHDQAIIRAAPRVGVARRFVTAISVHRNPRPAIMARLRHEQARAVRAPRFGVARRFVSTILVHRPPRAQVIARLRHRQAIVVRSSVRRPLSVKTVLAIFVNRDRRPAPVARRRQRDPLIVRSRISGLALRGRTPLVRRRSRPVLRERRPIIITRSARARRPPSGKPVVRRFTAILRARELRQMHRRGLLLRSLGGISPSQIRIYGYFRNLATGQSYGTATERDYQNTPQGAVESEPTAGEFDKPNPEMEVR